MSTLYKIAFFIACVGWVVFSVALYYGIQDRNRLEKDLEERGVTTFGIIYQRQHGIKSKMDFKYSFYVNNQRYTGRFGGYDGWKLYENDTIKLRYDPLDPTRNRRIKTPVEHEPADPREIIVAIVLIVFAGISYYRDYRRLTKKT